MSLRESNAHSETCKLLSFYLVPLQQLEKESMRINVKMLASLILFGFYLLLLFLFYHLSNKVENER